MGNNNPNFVPKITKEEFDKIKPHCNCPCNQLIPWKNHYRQRGIPKYIHGHNNTINTIIITKEQFEATSPHYCQCIDKCGQEIIWQNHYAYQGIPKYKHGHNKSTLDRKHTKEECKKMSDSHLGQISWNKGKKMSEESCKKMSEAKKGIIPWNKGKEMNDEYKKKCSRGRLGKPPWNKNKKMSEEYVLNCKKRASRHVPYTGLFHKNKLESYVEELLNLIYDGYYIYVGDSNKYISGLIPDFISKDNKKIIEVFGDYWHNEDKRVLTSSKTVRGRKRILRNKGYEILILWEKEIRQNKNYLYNKIMNFTGNVSC